MDKVVNNWGTGKLVAQSTSSNSFENERARVSCSRAFCSAYCTFRQLCNLWSLCRCASSAPLLLSLPSPELPLCDIACSRQAASLSLSLCLSLSRSPILLVGKTLPGQLLVYLAAPATALICSFSFIPFRFFSFVVWRSFSPCFFVYLANLFMFALWHIFGILPLKYSLS